MHFSTITTHLWPNFQQLNSILSKYLDLEWPSTTLYEQISLEMVHFYINNFNYVVDLGYKHQAVEYVRADGVHTNDIESLWCDAKRKFKAMNGCSLRSNIPSNLDEWIWETLWRVRGRNWTQFPLQGAMTCGKTNKTKTNNACLMKCKNCFVCFCQSSSWQR